MRRPLGRIDVWWRVGRAIRTFPRSAWSGAWRAAWEIADELVARPGEHRGREASIHLGWTPATLWRADRVHADAPFAARTTLRMTGG